MKKRICFILCAVLVFSFTGCKQKNDSQKGVYIVLPMQQTAAEAEVEIIDAYLSGVYDSFGEIKKNCPGILTHLMDATPKELEGKCKINRFTYESSTGVAGCTFLIYENEVYIIGSSFGGYGTTEFAYFESEEKTALYFICSFGSGIHRSVVGYFDFNAKETFTYSEAFYNQDICFNLLNGGKTLGVCNAQITWADYPNTEVKVTKGEVIHKDVNLLEFKTVSE